VEPVFRDWLPAGRKQLDWLSPPRDAGELPRQPVRLTPESRDGRWPGTAAANAEADHLISHNKQWRQALQRMTVGGAGLRERSNEHGRAVFPDDGDGCPAGSRG
jgi:hypothetical protein